MSNGRGTGSGRGGASAGAGAGAGGDTMARPGRGAAARARMLQAGLEAWMADPPATPFESLEVRDVVAAAGRTTGAFYHLWPSIDEYRRDLLSWVLEPTHIGSGPSSATDEIREAAQLIEASADPIPLVRAIAQAVLERNLDQERARTVTLVQYSALASAQGRGAAHQRARHALQASYQGIEGYYAPAYSEILRAWHRRVRPPWDELSASMALTALIDGYIMRALFDDRTVVGPDVFADALLAMITSLTEAAEAPADFDELTELELGAPPGDHVEIGDRVAAAVVEGYQQAGGFDALTVAGVARASGVSQRAVRESLGPGPESMAVPLVRLHLLPGLEARVEERRRSRPDEPLERLVELVHDVAVVAADDRALTRALLQLALTDPVSLRAEARTTIRAVLHLGDPEAIEARAAGQWRPEVVATVRDATDAGELLLTNVLIRVTTTRDRPERAAAHVLDRLLPGLAAATP